MCRLFLTSVLVFFDNARLHVGLGWIAIYTCVLLVVKPCELHCLS
jgi:hypothetical protein